MTSELAVAIKVGLKVKGVNQAALAEVLGVSEMQVSRWVTGKSFPDRENLFALRTYFGWPDEKVEALSSSWIEAKRGQTVSLSQRNVEVKSLAALRNAGFDEALVLATIDKIWDDFPLPDAPGNNMGTNEKWRSIYDVNPGMLNVVFDTAGEMAGYWHVAVLDDDRFSEVRQGINVNASLQPRDVIEPWDEGDYNLYFVDLVVLDGKRGNAAIARAVQRSFFDFLTGYANEGIFFRSILANVSSHWMRSICNHPGFQKVCDHSCHVRYGSGQVKEPTEIFEVDLSSERGREFLRSNSILMHTYGVHFSEVS